MIDPDEKLVDLDKIHHAVNDYKMALNNSRTPKRQKLERRRQLKTLLDDSIGVGKKIEKKSSILEMV